MRQLSTKPDWLEAQQRFTAWWDREPVDRPLLIVHANRKEPLISDPVPPGPETAEDRWLDIDGIIDRQKKEFAHTAYMAEAFPHMCPSLGPGTLGVYLGSHPEFSESTVWYEKCFDSAKEAKAVFNPENKWWKWTLEYTEKILAACENDFLPAFPDLIENLDTVAQLLGTMETVYNLADVPVEMHRIQQETVESYFKAYDALFEMMFPDKDESVFNFFQIWAPGRCMKMQCDIAALLSPDFFGEFAVPYFNKQCENLDYVLYHLDGPGALYSLDQLLEIQGINAIQWVSGAGNAPGYSEEWYDLNKKILDAGKGIWLASPPKEVKRLIKTYGSKGIFIHVGGKFKDEKEAEEFLRHIES
jgi:5-methyltetrahydrofolate--homocysteine methyltransferase